MKSFLAYLNILYYLAEVLGSKVFYGIDVDNRIYIYISDLDALKKKRFYIDLTGRDVSLEMAAYQYITLLMNRNYVIRHRRIHGYLTHRIRLLIGVKLPETYRISCK